MQKQTHTGMAKMKKAVDKDEGQLSILQMRV